MTEYYSGPTTPLDVARYGHVASKLREEMDKRGWKAADLNREMGHSLNNSGPYAWLKAKSAPSEAAAKKLAKIFGCSWRDLQGRKVIEGKATEMPQVPARVANGPGRPPGVKLLGAPPQPGRVFNFGVDEAGQARIQLDISMPLPEALPLVQLLLERGLIRGAPAAAGPRPVPDAQDEDEAA